MSEFKEFPKIFRYSREAVVTEKLDGTNAAVIIQDGKVIGAQSRTRLITVQDDNYSFSKWVEENKDILAAKLGDGHHYGEWWGAGIQRRYDMPRKEFWLFNVSRWKHLSDDADAKTIGMGCVPVLWEGLMDDLNVNIHMSVLREHGSVAAPGFMKPEGIVIFHAQSNMLLKKTFEKDSAGKGYGA